MKVNPTRIVVSVVVAVFCLLAQVGCAAVDMGAEHVAPAPESVAGKTLQFFCEKEAVAGAMPTRDENTYMFLTPGGEGGYVVTWHKKNEETSMSATPEGEKILTAATYTRTGKNNCKIAGIKLGRLLRIFFVCRKIYNSSFEKFQKFLLN